MKPARQILFFLCVFYSCKVFCQSYRENYELFTTRSGLPHNIVLSLAQDNRRLLWIGTRNGLCIYDGYEFEVKRNLFGDEGDWGNIFPVLYKDSGGDIWITTQTGKLGIYDISADSIIPIRTSLQYNEYISCIQQASSGLMWLGTNTGNLYGVTKEKRELFKITPENFGAVVSIQETPAGGTVINNFQFFGPRDSPSARKADTGIYKVVDSSRIRLFKNDGRVTTIYETEIVTRRHYTLSMPSPDRLLLVCPQLVKEYDTAGRLLNRIVISDPDSRNEDIANVVFEDATGILWMGTNAGLIKIDKEKYRFKKFTTGSPNAKLNSNYVRSVFADGQNNVWVGYKGGYVNRLHYDSTSKKYNSASCYYHNGLYNASSAAAINIIRPVGPGMLFGGAEGLFIIPADKQDDPPVLYDFLLKDEKGAAVRISEVWSVLEDRNGRLWVGTRSQGLYIIDPATRRYRLYRYNGITSTDTGLTSVWQIYQDHKGDIWLATENGLDSVIAGPGGYPERFYNLHDHYKGKAGRQVWSVTEDGQHNVWFGTTDKGFSMADKAGQQFITFDRSTGFGSNVTSGMLYVPPGYLWISTLNGITKFNISKRSFLHFTENDGLPGNDFNFNACCRAPSGQLLFGSKSGMVAFYPDEITPAPASGLPVLIRNISLWDKKYIDNPSKPVRLAYNQNFFSFRFALPDYRLSSSRFRYMLRGFNDQWTTTSTMHPVATFTNVPPGRYTLLVQGSPDGTRWSKPLTRLDVTVTPAFWQRPLFRLAVILLLFSAAAYIIYTRFKTSLAREREKNRLGQQFAELELRALQAQMNPHFIFNSINAIQHFMLSNNEIKANAYLSKFARLMRLYLESSKNKYIPVAEEIELLKLYVHLEHLRFGDKFDYEFSVGPYFDHAFIEIPSMLLQPYVENAINHGLAYRSTKGQLYISIRRVHNGILCVIEDNGVGRKEAAKHKPAGSRSRGMDMISDRLTTYRQVDNIEITVTIIDKQNTDGTPAGTRVEVLIPGTD